MSLLVIVEILNLGDIFHFFFDNVGVSTCCKKVIATTFLIPLAPKTSLLVVLVFLASLALVGGILLMLAIRYVSKKCVSEFSFSGVFLLLFHELVPSRIPGIDFLGPYG